MGQQKTHKKHLEQKNASGLPSVLSTKILARTKGQSDRKDQNISKHFHRIPCGTSSCNPVTLRDHYIPTHAASFEKPARRIVTGCCAVDLRFRLSRYMFVKQRKKYLPIHLKVMSKSHQECTKNYDMIEFYCYHICYYCVINHCGSLWIKPILAGSWQKEE